jgi:hypothetical protein
MGNENTHLDKSFLETAKHRNAKPVRGISMSLNDIPRGVHKKIVKYRSQITGKQMRKVSVKEAYVEALKVFSKSPDLLRLATHIQDMADDSYLTGHPEWEAIVKEAQQITKSL